MIGVKLEAELASGDLLLQTAQCLLRPETEGNKCTVCK